MTTSTPLQQAARKAIREALSPFGYEDPYLRFGWQVPNADAVRRYTEQEGRDPDARPSGTTRFLEVLAFADDRKQDWHTSAIAVDLSQDAAVGTDASERQARELFRVTAAPTNLIGGLGIRKVDIWFNCHDGIVGPETVDLATDPLKTAFRRHRASVQRDLLARLRAGQHHLFDGLVYARRDELANFLQRGVSKATWVAGTGDVAWGSNKEEIADRREAFSRVALALLAARILEDKGALGEDRAQSTDARSLLVKAQTKWDSFFDTVLSRDIIELDRWFQANRFDLMLSCLLSHLTGPVNFALVTHEMIGDLYERVLVADRSERSDNLVELKGVHYTPVAITKRILERIPLERLPVAERTVCDFACGSGSFLLAATDRLAGLYHPREPGAPKDRTEWVRSAVMGNDIDPVAVLVARLSYLVAYWNQVDHANKVPYPELHEGGDALTIDPLLVFKRLPSVIVGNPPFDGPKPASAFLDRALDLLLAKDGNYPRYIGMVMPGAFVKAKREQEAVRGRLLRETRILEVWELPEQAIGLWAEAPTCVIIAEILPTPLPLHQTVRVAQTLSRRADAVRALRDAGVTTWTYIREMQVDRRSDAAPSPDALAFSAIDDVWADLSRRGPAASEFAEVVWGFVHTKSRGQQEPEFSSSPGDDFVPYFRQQGALRPYSVTAADWRASHNDDQVYWKKGTGYGPYPGNWRNYESPKILVSAQSNLNSVSLLVAAIDRANYYPGKHFLVVTLLPTWEAAFRAAYPTVAHVSAENALRWYCAILNSPVGHAWFTKHAGPRGLQADICLTFPLPQTYNPAVAEAVARIEAKPRPNNLGLVPTWDPEVGIVTPPPDLFGAAQPDNEFWRAVGDVNRLVMASYGLDDRARARIVNLLRGVMDPWVEYPKDIATLPTSSTTKVVRGKAVSVDPSGQAVSVELSWKALGNGVPVRIPVPAFMPGWALNPGQEFTCRAPSKCTLADITANVWLLREFRPVPFDYLPIEALEQMIGYKEVSAQS